jgi:hypothetical protein
MPLPEIYRTDGYQAAQWERLAEYGHNATAYNMGFGGAMAQAPAPAGFNNTGAQAWNQLYNALNSQSLYGNHVPPSYLHQNVRWATVIRHA